MSVREREGLIARIRQIRRAGSPAQRTPQAPVDPTRDSIRALEERLEHLERLLEGLQDSVHRDSIRYGKRIAELEARIEPAALGKALSKDARDRGL
jgi:hypothetical protein